MGAQGGVTGSQYAGMFEMGGTIAGAYTASEAQRLQAQATKDQFETNARLAEWKAQDALKRGKLEAGKYRTQVKQAVGSQRAALAASGVDISDTGSAQDIMTETVVVGAKDALMIENNAFREAWGFQFQAMEDRFQGRLAAMQGKYAARNTLLMGGMQAAVTGFKTFGGSSRSDTGTSISKAKALESAGVPVTMPAYFNIKTGSTG